ncbi:jg22198 [Pararge aegeria aegeria]|uniref:Jg22198 protein n=1 Tax=Pararge aegeria aegeria TaxID=348720 RepID=A0A8S4QSV2_9NEOP|nr:jg22198 [Pararge aegeria aegeria]
MTLCLAEEEKFDEKHHVDDYKNLEIGIEDPTKVTTGRKIQKRHVDFNPPPFFDPYDYVQLLGVNISSNLNFGQYIESRAKTAGKKLGNLNMVKRYFTPEQLLTLYQSQVRSCMEYCSHLWDGSAKYQLDALDSVDRRARMLIGDLANKKLKSLEHRRKFACLSVFHRIYFVEFAQELFDPFRPSPFYHRTTRRRKDLHPYVVDIPRFASSFLIRTARI